MDAMPPRFICPVNLTEGLSYLEPVQRRAVLFGLECQIPLEDVVDLTHAQTARMQLSPICQSIVSQSPRHLRLPYLFWEQSEDGLVMPLLTIADDVQRAFPGSTWPGLLALYRCMVWVDHEVDMEDFMRVSREVGLSL
jgi:hypothetical protein